MKRLVILMMLLGLVATACASGRSIGGGLGDVGSTEIQESESPEPKAERPKKKRQEPKQEVQQEEEAPKGNTIIIAVRNNFDGFEYKQSDSNKWSSAFDGGPAVRVGDTIIFKNMDSEGNDHGWVNEADSSRGIEEGALFDSGRLKVGKQYTWVVEIDPGDYRYKDSAVPYRAAAGPLRVIARG